MARSLEEKREYFKKWYNLNKEKCLEKSKTQRATRETNHRVLKQEKCSECEKIGVHAKKLCKTCYSKMIRKTPEGKARVKLYNDTKGKIARQKFLSNKPPKPPKPPKEKKICDCGKVVIAKGLCRNCYQNKINNKNYTYKEKKVVDFTPIFEKVLKEVKKGMTIQSACKIMNISRHYFYDKTNSLQKEELKTAKILNKKRHDKYFLCE